MLLYTSMPAAIRDTGDADPTSGHILDDTGLTDTDYGDTDLGDTDPDATTAPQLLSDDETLAPPDHTAAIITGAVLGGATLLVLTILSATLYQRSLKRREANHSRGSSVPPAEKSSSTTFTSTTAPIIPWSTIDTVLVDGRFSSLTNSPARERQRSSGNSNNSNHSHSQPTSPAPQPPITAAATSALQPLFAAYYHHNAATSANGSCNSVSTADLSTSSTEILSVSDLSDPEEGPVAIPEAAAAVPGLGTRAWHRRKLSQAFAPIGAAAVVTPAPTTPVNESLFPVPLGVVQGESNGGSGAVDFPGPAGWLQGDSAGESDEMLPLFPGYAIWTTATDNVSTDNVSQVSGEEGAEERGSSGNSGRAVT